MAVSWSGRVDLIQETLLSPFGELLETTKYKQSTDQLLCTPVVGMDK